MVTASSFCDCILGPAEMIILIACGALHSLALSNNGRLFACGFGETNALGLVCSKNISTF